MKRSDLLLALLPTSVVMAAMQAWSCYRRQRGSRTMEARKVSVMRPVAIKTTAVGGFFFAFGSHWRW